MIMGTLTVKENITMSANLRLPKYVSAKERKQRIENILVELGLTNCANSKVIIGAHLSNPVTITYFNKKQRLF